MRKLDPQKSLQEIALEDLRLALLNASIKLGCASALAKPELRRRIVDINAHLDDLIIETFPEEAVPA